MSALWAKWRWTTADGKRPSTYPRCSSYTVNTAEKWYRLRVYEMPVQYGLGVLKEHLHTREKAGLFDVSHMGQIHLRGERCREALETLVPVDIVDLPVGSQRYALFTNDEAGILDDLMVTNFGDHLYLVVNAACKNADLERLLKHIGPQVEVEMLDRALIALQGPKAAEVLGALNPAVHGLTFMRSDHLELNGVSCVISRSGYTGEDGFEISIANQDVTAVTEHLLSHPDVEAIGLGARDSLRLEAGLCLYGHDLDETTSPVEGSLTWALSKSRRQDGARPGGYPGASIVMRQLDEGPARKRVGLKPEGRAPVREGAQLLDDSLTPIGAVTSGGFGPSVSAPIAMGYVTAGHHKPGTTVYAVVRNKEIPMTVTKMPFSPHRYHRG